MATAKKSGAASTAAPAPAPAAPDPSTHHAMAPRRGEPGETYSVTDARGVETKLTADAEGKVMPQSGEQVRVADAHNLPYWSDPEKAEAPAPAPAEPAEEK